MVECRDALDQPALDGGPLRAGDDAGQQIVWEDPFRPLFASVDGERDALMQKGQVRGLFTMAKFFFRQTEQLIEERLVMGMRQSGAREHLVERAIERVVRKRGWK